MLSVFFSIQNAVCFIILTHLVSILFTFYIQGVLKLKKNNSGAKRLICAQVFFTPLASPSTALRHVFFGLPLLRLPWRFHCRASLVISSIGLRSVWPSQPHSRFLSLVVWCASTAPYLLSGLARKFLVFSSNFY